MESMMTKRKTHRFFTVDYQPEFHVLAPSLAAPAFVHHDAYEETFIAAYRHLVDGSIVNVTSDPAQLVRMRDLWCSWMDMVCRPQRVFLYEDMASVPMSKISSQQQMFVEYAAVNNDFSSRPFTFECGHLQTLKTLGLHFVDASAATMLRCQEQFVARSPRIAAYREKFATQFAARIDYIEVPASEQQRANPQATISG